MTSAVQFEAFAVAAPGLESIVAEGTDRSWHSELNTIEGGVEFNATSTPALRGEPSAQDGQSRRDTTRDISVPLTFAELEKRARKSRGNWCLHRDNASRCASPAESRGSTTATQLRNGSNARSSKSPGGRQSGVADDEDAATRAPRGGQLIVVRFDHDHCTVSADSSGALPAPARLSHQRHAGTCARNTRRRAGSRQRLGQEVAAAGSILWLRDDSDRSGADRRTASRPGRTASSVHELAGIRSRRNGNACWTAPASRAETDSVPAIVGSDRTAAAIRAATENAERAGVSALPSFRASRRAESRIGRSSGLDRVQPAIRRASWRARDDSRRLMREFGQPAARRIPGGWQLACSRRPTVTRSSRAGPGCR